MRPSSALSRLWCCHRFISRAPCRAASDARRRSHALQRKRLSMPWQQHGGAGTTCVAASRIRAMHAGPPCIRMPAAGHALTPWLQRGGRNHACCCMPCMRASMHAGDAMHAYAGSPAGHPIFTPHLLEQERRPPGGACRVNAGLGPGGLVRGLNRGASTNSENEINVWGMNRARSEASLVRPHW